MDKNIIVIGCGSQEAIQSALDQIAVKTKQTPKFHMVAPKISKDELEAVALMFQEQDLTVMIVSAGLDIASELVPTSKLALDVPRIPIEKLLLTPNPKDTYYGPDHGGSKYIKNNKRNWRRG